VPHFLFYCCYCLSTVLSYHKVLCVIDWMQRTVKLVLPTLLSVVSRASITTFVASCARTTTPTVSSSVLRQSLSLSSPTVRRRSTSPTCPTGSGACCFTPSVSTWTYSPVASTGRGVRDRLRWRTKEGRVHLHLLEFLSRNIWTKTRQEFAEENNL